jgi:hypothetical protein
MSNEIGLIILDAKTNKHQKKLYFFYLFDFKPKNSQNDTQLVFYVLQ